MFSGRKFTARFIRMLLILISDLISEVIKNVSIQTLDETYGNGSEGFSSLQGA